MGTFSQSGVVWDSITKNGRYEPFELQVSRGQITDHSVVSIFGYQTAIPTSGFVPVWENATAYSYPSSAVTMTLASSSSSDAGVSVLINGLDANYLPLSETIAFTAGNYTGVTTTNSYFRINSMSLTVVPSAGSSNVGTITLKNGGTTYAQINPGIGRTQSAIYTVPANGTFYLKRTQGWTSMVYTSGNYGTYRTWTVNAAGVNSLVTQRPFVSNFISERWYPNVYAPKTDIQWQMAATGAAFAAGFSAEGVLVSTDTTTNF